MFEGPERKVQTEFSRQNHGVEKETATPDTTCIQPTIESIHAVIGSKIARRGSLVRSRFRTSSRWDMLATRRSSSNAYNETTSLVSRESLERNRQRISERRTGHVILIEEAGPEGPDGPGTHKGSLTRDQGHYLLAKVHLKINPVLRRDLLIALL